MAEPVFAPGAATGIGSMPGADVVETTRIVFGELPLFPHLPELPGRGAGAEIIGRTAALLVELPVELYAGAWQASARAGRDLRRTLDLLERDLDALTERADGYEGPLKVQAAGPWTLAASLRRGTGGVLLRDSGAVRDLTGSLAEGLRAHVAEIRRRVPGAVPVLQLDEPSLPAVLAGRVPTDSGLSTYRAVEEPVAAARLRTVVEGAGVPVVVHCCAADAPVRLLANETGVAGLALDLDLVDLDGAAGLDPLGEALDGGMWLLAGTSAAEPENPVRTLWRRLGLPAARLPRQVVVTPSCGLAGRTPAQARTALAACARAGARIADDPEA